MKYFDTRCRSYYNETLHSPYGVENAYMASPFLSASLGNLVTMANKFTIYQGKHYYLNDFLIDLSEVPEYWFTLL